MSVDFLSKNFPPFQVHHAKKPPRFYPDGFQRNVIDFYFIFSDCRLRKALYLQFSYFIWPLCWSYTKSGVYNLPRTTAQEIYNKCVKLPREKAVAGDLVFFTKTYPTSSPVTHIGIYVGNGRMLHCGDPIGYASIDTAYWQQHFYSFGRLP